MPKTCVLFTAPHSKEFREGHSNRTHSREQYTEDLAKTFAKTIGGGYIVWNKAAIDNANTDKPRKSDPRYWDPNFLPDTRRTWYGWMKYMHEARKNCIAALSGLHVDLHGMGDATAIRLGEHLIIGTRAMETVKNNPRQYDETKSKKLKANLTKALEATFINLRTKLILKRKGGRSKLPLRIARGKEPGGTETFVGDWGSGGYPFGKGTNSMTRISTEKRLWSTYRKDDVQKPFGCAVQVEMSEELRKVLNKEKKVAKEMAEKILDAFRATGCKYNNMDTSPTTDVSY